MNSCSDVSHQNQSPIEKRTIDTCSLTIIGTAHVSKESAELVARIISDEAPNIVCVELCEPRLETIDDPDKWKKTDIFTVIKSGKTLVLFVQLVLGSFQKRLAKKLDIEPGAEMKVALKEGRKINAKIFPIDRNIRVTLRRTWSNMSFWTISKLFWSSIWNYSSGDEIEESEIEALKVKDELTAALEEFSQGLPEVKETLIDERDRYMAGALRKIAEDHPNSSILAVVGAGHLPGMLNVLDNNIVVDQDELDLIPPPSLITTIIGWIIPVFLLAGLVYSFVFVDIAKVYSIFEMWVVYTAVFAGIGALAALAHPISILAAMLAAPIAALHPAIATGWVSGLVEAWLRKPQVSDFETLEADLSTLKGFWGNRVVRIVLVVLFSNIGCIVGQVVSSFYIVDSLM